ncbi:tRNA1(Val) (adenine(37)-N6)-methyltransferase [Sphingobacterium sp. BN32]|uniref:tRNA1(Val) (adenine(37)-N6)-methyltransferase n=1 Tax=Sphingobacterium sp. BN32 TaxID=3058432 RepID=UPI00265CA92C|nr:methyltransferase [Sphingobacterium sp. BN32]WKK59033.1 methyltransferase [Sphingobacterium sp. BN32]
MGSIFQFKQFAVDQQDCPMRINTDGVILGAHAYADSPKHILDIGTGTGVIALMLAQRFEQATVTGVEIDELAAHTALENFKASPFVDRLELVNSDIFLWTPAISYDLIVSNPPFYINSLHNPDARRKTAKHTDVTFFEGLLDFVALHLNSTGKLQIIVPVELKDFLVSMAASKGLHLLEELKIRSFDDAEPIRLILSFTKMQGVDFASEGFVIYKDRGQHSEAYRQLLKPFFLAF